MARKSKTAAEAVAPQTLVLPAELTIYTVGELHPAWLAWLHGDAAATGAAHGAVNAEAVAQVDAAGVQLLLALQRSLSEKGQRLFLQGASDALRAGCEALGLHGWLQAQAPEAAVTGATA